MSDSEHDDLRARVTQLEADKRDLSRELSSVKGDLVKATNSAKTFEDLIAKRETELAEARDHLKETNAEARERRLELRKAEEERDTLFTAYTELETERDTLTEQLTADPDGLRAKMAQYENAIRGIKHERAYEKIAKDLSVNDPIKFKDLIRLAGYEPTGEDPDEESIKTSFGEVIKQRSWLVDTPAPAPVVEVPPPAVDPAANGHANGQTPNPAQVLAAQVAGRLQSPPPAPAPGHDRGITPTTTQPERPVRVMGKL